MTTPRVALAGLVSGVCFALGMMGAYAVRAAYSITRQHHWPDLHKL